MARLFSTSNNQKVDIATGVSTSGVLTMTGAMTLAAWVNFTDFTIGVGNETAQTVVGKVFSGAVDSRTPYQLQLTANTPSFTFNCYDGTNAHGVTGSPASFATGAWHHLAGTFDGTNLFTLWADGTSVNTHTDAAGISGSVNPLDVFIGASYNTGISAEVQHMHGNVADAAIWSVALTALELTGLTKGIRPNRVRPSSLAGWWPLDGIQSPEADLSGNNNSGVVTGATQSFGAPFVPISPRRPLNFSYAAAAGAPQTFQPAWAFNKEVVIQGIGF